MPLKQYKLTLDSILYLILSVGLAGTICAAYTNEKYIHMFFCAFALVCVNLAFFSRHYNHQQIPIGTLLSLCVVAVISNLVKAAAFILALIITVYDTVVYFKHTVRLHYLEEYHALCNHFYRQPQKYHDATHR